MRAAIVTAALLFGGNALAQGYGTAGCGLGSVVFGAKPGMIQVLAATTNGTFASQTFGITSGTSNCASGGGGGDKAARVFIEANREALAKDISRGGGETILNLSSLAGCADEKAVGATLQRSFQVIFPSVAAPDAAVTESILQTLKSEKALACGKLG